MKICDLCDAKSELLLYSNSFLRIILAQNEVDYPSTCRVILNRHITEMTDLSNDERCQFMSAVWSVERALRNILMPDKINLASLGNQVEHLHWHVIPRFANDANFPDSIWSTRKREGVKHYLPNLAELLKQQLSNID